MKRSLVLLAACLVVTPAGAARPVKGVVSTLLRPLEGAAVVVPDVGRFAATDSLGRYDLGVLPPGLYGITVAAMGYESVRGTFTVRADSTTPDGAWLMKPLRPEGQGAGTLLPKPQPPPADERALEDSLLRRPGPGPIAPEVGLYLTPDELSRRATLPGALGELVPQIATADSITFDSGGTGQPGFETWRQWSERLQPQAAGDAPFAQTARRALAYTRTRAALAAGPNWIGWQASKTARAAIAGSRLDARSGAPGAAFLAALEARLDAVFVRGKEPARPAPVRPKRAPAKKKRRRR